MKEEQLKNTALGYLEKQDYRSLAELISETFNLSVLNSNVSIISEGLINILGDLLNKLLAVTLITYDKNTILPIEHLFKALRNCSVNNRTAQNWIASHETILNDTQEFCETFRSNNEDCIVSCIKLLLQFLNNLVVKNEESSRIVWEEFNEFLGDFIIDKNYTYFSSALAYNMLYTAVTILKDKEHILRSIFDVYKDYENNEYLHFLLELFVKNKELNITYVFYDINHRLLFLTMFKDLLQENRVEVTSELLKTLSHEFKTKSDCILKTVSSYVDKIEPVEVTLLLDVLATISGNDKHLPFIQSDKSLLINCIYLLKSVHEVSKQPDNNFSILSKLSDLSISNESEMTMQPSFGFKGALIRLIGNMCWKHKANQELVRELDGIPLLLDCCNMDSRNPYIIQWVIYAIRNLCENNLKVQKTISSMNKKGIVSNETLNEFGICLNDDGTAKINVIPYPSKV